MKIYKYGITLKRITEDDLELVRNWRNSDFVRKRMEFQEHISPEQQKEWFHQIDNHEHFYYIIHYKGEDVGLINNRILIKDGKEESDSGLFIGNLKFLKTHIPVLASIVLIELGVYILGSEKSYVRTLKSNKEAIAYNKTLGYKLLEGQDDVENQWYEFTKENFEKATGKIRKAVSRFSDKDYPNGYVLFEKHDYENGIAQSFEKIMKEHPTLTFHKKEVMDGNLFFY